MPRSRLQGAVIANYDIETLLPITFLRQFVAQTGKAVIPLKWAFCK